MPNISFQALDGFLLVVTQGGTILFASESVTSLLNHLPVSEQGSINT